MNQQNAPEKIRNSRISNEEKNNIAPFGFSLLLVTFLVLCLFTFAAITLVSARNDTKTSQANADRRTAYYTACNTAEQKLAKLNKETSADTASAEKNVDFTVDIDDSDILEVSLTLSDGSSPHYTVDKWAVVSDDNWQPETKLPVLQTGD